MKNSLILALLVVLAACQPGNELETKKAQLAAYRAEMDELKTKMNALEKEIALLDTAAAVQKPKLVTLAAVTRSDFNHFIDLQGSVESEEDIAVQPGMPGVVTRVYVKEGDPVSPGKILAETDNRAIRESVEQLKANLDFARTAYEKQKRLWDKKIGSEMQYLQAKTQVESLEKSLSSLEAQLDMSRIKSPISGVVDQVNVKIGEYAAPGFSGAFRVVNVNSMKVTAKVADSYIGKVKVGNPVQVRVTDLNDTLNAKITYVGKVVDPMSRTFRIEINVSGMNTEIRPNMLSIVSINDQTIPQAVNLPANYVQRDAEGRTYVMVAEGSKGKMVARKKLVSTGIAYGDRVVITSGLDGSEQYIVSGYQEVTDGQPLVL
jgi:membrane fusion protein (multidrug efflux system)